MNGDPTKNQLSYIDWIELIRFEETRNYVQRVLENVNVYKYMIAKQPVKIGEILNNTGGERGIRTLGTTFQSYVGLANRWFKPTHPSHP